MTSRCQLAGVNAPQKFILEALASDEQHIGPMGTQAFGGSPVAWLRMPWSLGTSSQWARAPPGDYAATAVHIASHGIAALLVLIDGTFCLP